MTQPALPGIVKYVGWFRNANGGPWEPVCEAETEKACWVKLLWYKPVAVQQCEKAVLIEGKHP